MAPVITMTSTGFNAEDHSRVILGDQGEMQTSIGAEEDAEKPKILPFSVEALMAERRPSSSAGAAHTHADPGRAGARLAFSVDVLKLSEQSAWMHQLSPRELQQCTGRSGAREALTVACFESVLMSNNVHGGTPFTKIVLL